MPIRLSYINARGEEAILDDDEGTFAHELQGRSGFEFPTLKLSEKKFGDGTSRVVSISVKEREITCSFWADPPDILHWEEKFNEVKAILLQIGQREDDWGKLKIRMEDGHYVYLNCVYSKGLDSLIRDINSRIKFSLTFKATDPYFYNGFEYGYTIRQDDKSGYIFFNNAAIVDSKAEAIELTGEPDKGNPKLQNLWYKISGTDQYYAIVPPETLYMDTAQIFDNQQEAIDATGEEEPGNHWWAVEFEETDYFDTQAGAISFTAETRPNRKWWSIVIDDVPMYQARRTVTKYYAILKQATLYFASSRVNMNNDLYIQSDRVYPDIIINGPAESICISNNTTGRKIELDQSIKLEINDQIRITTTPTKRKITKYFNESDKKVNLIPWLTPDTTLDWFMEHGYNDVKFNNTASTPESYIKFTYTERYGGAL